METRHQMKAEKKEKKSGQRRVEVAKACFNHLKRFKKCPTFFVFRFVNLLYSARSLKKNEISFFSDLRL